LRNHINFNDKRNDFISDLQSEKSYKKLNKKWAKKTTLKLLWQKYVWGNRQKMFLWNLKNKKK